MLLSIAACTLASIACATVLTGPIRKLSRSTRSMASGQYSYRVKVRSRDELGALAEDFNHMADALERKIQELAGSPSGRRLYSLLAHELEDAPHLCDRLRRYVAQPGAAPPAAAGGGQLYFHGRKAAGGHVLCPAGFICPGAVPASAGAYPGAGAGPVCGG
ncbi:MAG: HAMP domain-containing protein [Oscillospiraceae bacterium]